MTASPARMTALAIVTRVREREGYAHETADAVFRATPKLDVRDRALATRLAYGTIATTGTLDEALDRHISRPTRVEPRVRDALQIATWELLFGGVDPHVAVSEGVDLVRSVRPHASGLANAVLRRLAEASAQFPWGDPSTDDTALARLYGHPLWMTQRLIAELGRPAAEAVLAADNEPAPVFLALLVPELQWERIRADLEEAGAEPRPGPLVGSIELARPSAMTRTSLLAEGVVEVCDAAAQLAAHLVGAAPNMTIVDIGAGRGTKTLLLQARARAAGGDAKIWAVDSHAFKLGVLTERAALVGFEGITTTVADATRLPFAEGVPAHGEADAVLVDAPCSGLGTLRRHPDKRWRLQEADTEILAMLAARLLEQAAQLVRSGGFMVYSTCTLGTRENRDVVETFLASDAGRDFTVDDVSADVPDAWLGFVSEEGFFQSIPEVGGPDGHFIARLRRR